MDTTTLFSKQLKQAQGVLQNAYEDLQEHFNELVSVNEELRQEIVEHQRIEEALTKSQQRYKTLVNSIDGIVWEADPNTFQFTFISKQAKRFLGYPLKDWLNNPTFWADHIHPDDQSWAVDYCATATAHKKDHDFEYRMITADNRIIWIRDIVTVVVENGQAVKLCGVMLDITQQKQSEEKLSIFQKFIENSNEGMGMATLDGKIAYMNPTLCRFVDEPQLDKAEGKNIIRYYSETSQQHFQEQVLPQIMTTGSWAGETETLSSKGKIIKTFESWFLLKDKNEKPLYLGAVISDITERKQMEEKLRFSEERFRKIFEEGPVGISLTTTDYHFIKVNKALCQFLGYTETEFSQLTVIDITHPEDISNSQKIGHQLLNSDVTSLQIEKRYLTKQKKIVWGNLTVSAYWNENQELLYFISIIEDITERKQAEEALQNSEAMLARAQKIAHLGTWEWDIQNNRQTWSDEGYRLFGLQPGSIEASFDNFVQMVHPDDRKYLLQAGQRLLAGNTTRESYEYRIIWADGTEHIISSVSLNYFDEKEQVIKIVGTSLDITERKQAEEAIQTLTEHLSSIVDSLPVIPYTRKAKGDFGATYVGKNIYEVTGYLANAFISDSTFWAKHIHPNDQAMVFKKLSRILDTGHDEQEYRFRMADGSYKWLSDTLRLITTPTGEISHIAGIWQDITERKKFEAGLRESETRIRSILDNVVDGVITINDQGQIKSFNPAAEQIFGYSVHQVFNKNINMLMPEPYHSQHDGYINHYQTTGIAKIINIGREVEGQRKDGSVFPLDLAVGEMWLGEQQMFIGIVRNITERKQAEMALKNAKEAAELANRAKSEFLANMSHEIRTPLNAVIGFSELLSSVITDKKQQNYLDSIQTAGKSLLRLINDILDLSKMEAGRLDIQYDILNPFIIFNELQQIFALKIAEKQLEFLVDIDPQLPTALLLDETRLRQVLLNLIGNAIKFTDTGYIKLTAQKIDKPNEPNKIDIIISITDTGIGIPENQQAIVFESFRQQDGQSTRKYGGTGLGLAITKRLVEMMNGHISIQSQVGKGCVFEIRLTEVKVSAADTVEESDKHVHFQNIRFDRAKVLVVDDIASNRCLMKEYLSPANLEVIEAKNGLEALIVVEEVRPALILMDIRMPEMNGYEATKKIKTNPNSCDIPIIALTATLNEKNRLETYGFDGYLSKPVNGSALFNEISHYLAYTTKNIAPNSKSKTEESDSIPTDIVEVAALCQTLEEEVLPLWQELVDMIETDAVETFAEQLIQLSKKHHAQCLIDYAESLHELAQDFDIEGIEQALKKFPAQLNSLKANSE